MSYRPHKKANYLFLPYGSDQFIFGRLYTNGMWRYAGDPNYIERIPSDDDVISSSRAITRFVYNQVQVRQPPTGGLALRLTDRNFDIIKKYVNEFNSAFNDPVSANWMVKVINAAHHESGMSFQTLSDHLAYLNSSNEDILSVVFGYTEGSSRFNHAHRPGYKERGGFWATEISGHNARRLNQYIMAAPPLDAPAVVYRVSSAGEIDFYWFCSNLDNRVSPWRDHLVSTSFARFGDFEGIYFVISLPVGTCGLALIHPSCIRYLDDYEFLLPVGTEFIVRKCEIDRHGKSVVHLDLVGPVREPSPSGIIDLPKPLPEEYNEYGIYVSKPRLYYRDLREFIFETFSGSLEQW